MQNYQTKIFFIDTGYHFKETLIYKEYLTHLYDLKVEDIRAEEWKHNFTTSVVITIESQQRICKR